MTRRELREHSFKMAFSIEFYKSEEMKGQLNLYLGHYDEIKDEDRSYLLEKAVNMINHKTELDDKINSIAKGWKTSRMSKVDLAIIRLALYEILYDDQVPQGVAINEAVELAKQFGGDESPAFINGILAKLVA